MKEIKHGYARRLQKFRVPSALDRLRSFHLFTNPPSLEALPRLSGGHLAERMPVERLVEIEAVRNQALGQAYACVTPPR